MRHPRAGRQGKEYSERRFTHGLPSYVAGKVTRDCGCAQKILRMRSVPGAGVPERAARVGWWMRPGNIMANSILAISCDPVATAPGTDFTTKLIARFSVITNQHSGCIWCPAAENGRV